MYKLYTHKELKCGFIILCPEHNVQLLQNTFKSIKSQYDGMCICVTDDSVTDECMKELNNICFTYKGGKTYTSLINTGFEHAPAPWNFVVIAGTTMRARLNDKFSFFVENDRDILFPIADGKTNFIDGTLNGLFIHKEAFKEVGQMEIDGHLAECKAIWAEKAIANGYRFKAIIGSKMC